MPSTRRRSRHSRTGHGAIFLSYNAADKATARLVGGQLALAGADVWFDEWKIRAGDSIPGKLNEGLSSFDVFVLLWSRHARRSKWVRLELEAAITRRLADHEARIVPVRLDATDLPELLRPLSYLRLTTDADVPGVVMEVLGISAQREFLMALQRGFNELNLDYTYHPACGMLLCCPGCGTSISDLKPWAFYDEAHDDEYVGLRCDKCGWQDGGEI